MVIVLNRYACAGLAGERWASVESLVRRRVGRFTLINADNDTGSLLMRCLNDGERIFAAAGGDGTVNALINLLIRTASADQFRSLRIGAIGLGSSNDFHKPFQPSNVLGAFPCRLDADSATAQDLGIVCGTDSLGREFERCWINNASIGITAEANQAFNHPTRFVRWLKTAHTGSAILHTAVSTIMSYRNIEGRLSADDAGDEAVEVTNLGIVKNPHFSGSFCYDSPLERGNGAFFVHLCEAMTRPQAIRTLYELSNRRFLGLDRTRSFKACMLRFTARAPFTIEYDGETITARHADFSLINEGITLCV